MSEQNNKLELTGKIIYKKTEGEKCICCKGKHIFSAHIDLDDSINSVNELINQFITTDKISNENKKVRVTVEIIYGS